MTPFNMGNWYNPLTPAMAGLLLIFSISIECSVIFFLLSGEAKWKIWEIVLAVAGANVVSFVFGWLFLMFNGVL